MKQYQDGQLTKYTVMVGKSTVGLLLVAIGQAFLFLWQLVYMRFSMQRAEASIKAAELSAKAAQDSVEISRHHLTVLERPWLLHTATRVIRREGPPIQPTLLNNWYIGFQLKNMGRSPARIIEFRFRIIPTADAPEVPDYNLLTGDLDFQILTAPGAEAESSTVGPAPEHSPNPLTVFVRITYAELNGVEHHTAFAVDVSPSLPASSTHRNRRYEWYD
jgi:hypothetical protein